MRDDLFLRRFYVEIGSAGDFFARVGLRVEQLWALLGIRYSRFDPIVVSEQARTLTARPVCKWDGFILYMLNVQLISKRFLRGELRSLDRRKPQRLKGDSRKSQMRILYFPRGFCMAWRDPLFFRTARIKRAPRLVSKPREALLGMPPTNIFLTLPVDIGFAFLSRFSRARLIDIW